MSTSEACPVVSLNALWYFIAEYYYIFGLLGILFGLWLMILGGRMYKITLFFFGEFAISTFIMVVMYAWVYPEYAPTWTVWLTGVVALGMGAGIGFAS